MKRVIIFLLCAVLAVGGLGFAHATVTDAQDELLIYPIREVGDPAAVDGLTVSVTFACGDHLRWHTDYTFGGETETEFRYSAEPIRPPEDGWRNSMTVYLSPGTGTSTSGSFPLVGSGYYTALFRAVADQTANGGSKTMDLKMADYVDYYLPNYELYYNGSDAYCHQNATTHGIIGWESYEEHGAYHLLMKAFRFPVQEDHMVTVGIGKNDAGAVNSLDFNSVTGPSLEFLADVTDEGVWFVPVFLDENGAPLPYESPEGHGIYHIPWKLDHTVTYGGYSRSLTLDVAKAERVAELDETVPILDIIIDADEKEAWMLTKEDGQLVLTRQDLAAGVEDMRAELLPLEDEGLHFVDFLEDGGYLLVCSAGSVTLVDKENGAVLLTAPDVRDEEFAARIHNPQTGDLRFDGETLVILNSSHHRQGAFWTAAWRQGELVYYGEYDCSLMRGNDEWYYCYITTDEEPVELIG